MGTTFAPALTTAFIVSFRRAEMIMWAIQIFLAVAFGAAGTMKLVRSKAQLAANPHMGWVHSVPEDRIKLLGVAEILGAIGLVVPIATGIAPILTRVAAVCLATLMGGAAATHTMRGESAAVSTILAVLVIAVAAFR
jgi:DoxX-like family